MSIRNRSYRVGDKQRSSLKSPFSDDTIISQFSCRHYLGESGNVFYAVPTWVFDCLYVRDARQKIKPRQEDDASCADIYERPEFRRLIINAQTAKILDPLSKDRSRFKFSGFLSWEDVQKGIKK